MNRRQISWFVSILLAAAMLLAGLDGTVWAQLGGITPGSQFELAEAVQLDLVDNAVLAQLDRVKTLLADRQWDEAIEILRQLSESPEEKLVSCDKRDSPVFANAKMGTVPVERRYISLRDWCQLQLASLPPEGLKLYRGRVDTAAKNWYEQGLARRDPKLLQNVVDQAYASTYGDDALMALGDMAFESGDFTAARSSWERIVPAKPAAGKLGRGYPDTNLDLAAVRARLVLVSILEGTTARARSELAQFARLHPDAQGRLGDREGRYVQLLETLLAEQASWPARDCPNFRGHRPGTAAQQWSAMVDENGTVPFTPADWPTFAGNPQRNKIASPLEDVGAIKWRIPLWPTPSAAEGRRESRTIGENPREPLSFHPVLVGDLALINNDEQILAVRLGTGKPAWGSSATIYQSELAGLAGAQVIPFDAIGSPRFTMTAFNGRLYARMGSCITGQSQETSAPLRPGYLVCLDLAAEGRLLWKTAPEEGWALEGSPLADDQCVYVAMRRRDIRPQAFVACFDADTGRLRWRRFICGAETPARGVFPECTHNLLTLSGGVLYYNTNLGAVGAIRANDGRVLWISLYPRALHGDLAKLAPHWRRDLNPCVLDHGTLYVAPADSPRIFAFDAASGQALWQTGTEVEDAVHLLGVAGDWLIAGGGKLYWINLKEEDRGRVKHVWPDGPERPGFGRGVLAGGSVLWPTRDKLYIFDQQTAQPRRVVALTPRGASGGNLLSAQGQLLIATESELIAIGTQGGKPRNGKDTQIDNQ